MNIKVRENINGKALRRQKMIGIIIDDELGYRDERCLKKNAVLMNAIRKL
jgi:hypothetical protein